MLERVEKGIHEHDSHHTAGGSKGALLIGRGEQKYRINREKNNQKNRIKKEN